MTTLKSYKNRYGGYGIVPSDSTLTGTAIDVGAARTEEYARLFASAPALLDICLRICALCDSGVSLPGSMMDLDRAARAAVNAATGKE